jgi:hypothetical protein
MIDGITNFVENKRRTTQRSRGQKFIPVLPRRPEADKHEQRTGFTKVFRWPVPADQTPPPTTVEVVGSFSGWRKVPLTFDPPTRTFVTDLIRAWVTDLVFWVLFVTDVFAVCYWPTSGLGALLVKSEILPPKTATVVVLVLSALLTVAVVRGIILLLKRKGIGFESTS